MAPVKWTQYEDLMVHMYEAGWTPTQISTVIRSTYGDVVPITSIRGKLRNLGVEMRGPGSEPGKCNRPATPRSKAITKLILHMYFVYDMIPVQIVAAMKERFPEVKDTNAVDRRIRRAGYQLYPRATQIRKAVKRGLAKRQRPTSSSGSFISTREAELVGVTYYPGMRRQDMEAALALRDDEGGTSGAGDRRSQGDRERETS